MIIKEIKKAMNEEQMNKVASDDSRPKSARIIEMFEAGKDVKTISTVMNIRYNHAYNVIQNHILVTGVEYTKKARGTSEQRQKIEDMLNAGESMKAVATALRVTYNTVWRINNELKTTEKAVEKVEVQLEKKPEPKLEEKKSNKKGSK